MATRERAGRRPYEPMRLTRHRLGAMSKYSGAAVNTRAPLVPTTVVDRIEGCEVSALLREFGSPLFVVSEARLRGEFRDFRGAFRQAYPQTEIAYSYKTNYLTGIRAILHQEGAWAEVVSGLEYEMAERLGVPGHQIIFNGPHKTEDDLRRAMKDGALINVDSFDELATIERLAQADSTRATIGLRVHARVTDVPWDKFGFSLEAGFAEEAARRAATSRWLALTALHGHLGTDLSDPAPYAALLRELMPLMARLEQRHGVRWKMIDLGGGYPNRHRYARVQGVPVERVFPNFASAIASPLAAGVAQLRSRPTLVLEPGRAIVEHPVFLLTTVSAAKRLASGVKAAVVDAGVHLLPTAYYTALDIAPAALGALSVEEVTLYGPLCMQVDCLATAVRLPPLTRGTPLVIRNCGAYTVSQSMQFIHARPAVTLVSGDTAELIREAEDVEDFVGRDRVPERLRRKRRPR